MAKTTVTRGEIVPQQVPQDIEAEKYLLGDFFQKNELIDRYRGKIEPRHFYREAHRVLYEAMLTLRARGQGVDLVTIADELRKKELLERVGRRLRYGAVRQNQAAGRGRRLQCKRRSGKGSQ